MLHHALRAKGQPAVVIPPAFVAVSGTRSSSSPITVTKPTGTAELDMMVAFIMAASAGASISLPSGWTLLTSDDTGNNTGGVAYKIAGASEPSSYDFAIGGSFGRAVQIATVRNVTSISAGVFEEASTNTLAAPSIVATAGMLFGWFSAESTPTLSTPPAGMTEALETGGGPVSWVFYESVSSGATGDKTLVISGANDHRSILVNLY